ncbi:hypothetical protein BT96DRAFT_1001086 [Gymnopus androsaceus JB14]|uniref:Uncharacterized protein n=1 Tax=Gymnopus androsaceus JB14 TaxID=1447944 RepID=A0A6A4H3C1_9AGAR|nr:hypothetical protein BT96DRAFT_1001086 [Gymnopus androsaceus JB14]
MCYDFQNDKVPRDRVTVTGTLGHNYTVEGMDKFLVLELFDCLHAPDALVNLILTGTLLEKKFSLYMTEDVVRVYIPNTPQFLIVVDVYHRLCLLRGEFLSDKVEALSDLLPSVMATFMPRIPNGDLFHECLLHIGKQTVNEVLTGNYANGLDNTLTSLIPIMEIAPLALSNSLLLILCGQMPILSAHKSSHFNVIMDDNTSAIGGGCFAKKNQALKVIKSTINTWETMTGEQVQSVYLDGVKEFHGEEASQYFISKGILVQQTALYSHQQNDKAERWV